MEKSVRLTTALATGLLVILNSASYGQQVKTVDPIPKPKAASQVVCRVDGAPEGLTLKTTNLSVFERQSGRTMSTLKLEDFILRENGEEREIGRVGQSRVPLSVALLVDTSPSRTNRLGEVGRAANKIIGTLAPNDTLTVITFDGIVNYLVRAKRVADIGARDIDIARAHHGTRLFDAVEGAMKVGFGPSGSRKVMILFTDGMDNSSQTGTADSTLRDIREADVMIFTFQYDYQGLVTKSRYLKDLSDETGGKLFVSTDVKEFTTGITSILDAVATQYTLCFWSPEPAQRNVSVKLRSVEQGTYAIRMHK